MTKGTGTLTHLALDCDGVMFNTMDEDLLYIHNTIANNPDLCPYAEGKEMEVLSPGECKAKLKEIRKELWPAIEYRSYVILAEYYLAVLDLANMGMMPPAVTDYQGVRAMVKDYISSKDNRDRIMDFKREFYKSRDEARKVDYQGTLDMVSMYPGIRGLIERGKNKGMDIVVVTGRTERSTREMVEGFSLDLGEIFGREREKSKQEILAEINPISEGIVFLDDNLENVRTCMEAAKVYLATWGYVPKDWRSQAVRMGVKGIRSPEDCQI